MPLEPTIPLANLAQKTVEAFQKRYGRAPTIVAAAPGRVNLIGEHTDYNEGFVLPMAIDRYTVVAVAPIEQAEARLASETMDSAATLAADGKATGEQPGWAKYAAGVLSVYSDEGLPAPGFEAMIDSSVPLGGGLSSSAALEVSLATAIEALAGVEPDDQRKALFCQQAEHRAGVPCGVMDQFSSALCQADHAMLLDCRDLTTEMEPLTDPGITVLITNSNVKHELTGGEYAERRTQCEQAVEKLGVKSLREATMDQVAGADLEGLLLQRARHVVGEIGRTTQAAVAMRAGDWEQMGQLMYGSHDSLRDDYQVSIPELDALVEAAQAIGLAGGVYGSRMTGGGFGGCTVSLVQTAKAEQIAEQIAQQYQQRTGQTATQFVTRPSRGAHLIG